MVGTSAFALPVLPAKGCKAICDRSTSWSFTPNDDEAPDHQIAEAVPLDVDPDYDKLVQSVLMTGLAP